jgi:hypothetical protein
VISDDDTAEMVYLMLDYLSLEIAENITAALELFVHVFHGNYAVTGYRTDSA